MYRATSMAAVGALATALSWGAMFTVAKTAFVHLDPLSLTAARFVVATVVFMAVLAVREGLPALIPGRRVAALWFVGTVGFAGFNMLAYIGLSYAQPQAISLVIATMPMITLLVLWVRSGKRPVTPALLFSAIALVGVAMVLGDGNPVVVFCGAFSLGVPLALAGVIAWVIYTTSRSSFPELSLLRFTTHTCLLGTVSIVVLTAVLRRDEPWPTQADVATAAWQVLYMALPATVLAVLAWNHAVATLGAANAALFINLVPITAFTIEALRGHRPSVGELAGVGVTLLALLALNLVVRRKPTPGVGGAARHSSAPFSSGVAPLRQSHEGLTRLR